MNGLGFLFCVGSKFKWVAFYFLEFFVGVKVGGGVWLGWGFFKFGNVKKFNGEVGF